MSDDIVIRGENLSKLYRLGELHKQTGSFRDMVTNSFRSALSVLRRAPSNSPNPMPISPDATLHAPSAMQSSNDDFIWALRDVSFEVKQGEILGIIGRNGAGKTTLLKILSRITRPTKGKAWINGRVGSLLEVGTGFHAELTGRENIYLNGAILGMKKEEIRRKFDEIVSFAEIKKFIDTPVKRYSSGMYVRLAFAVAAHLEPEILLVDEVLAVGDAAFQKKCLGKMQDVSGEGRTVLFVSHNMAVVQRLCPRALLLNEGSLLAEGPTQHVVRTYLESGSVMPAERTWESPHEGPGGDVARLKAVRVTDQAGNVMGKVDIRQPFGIEVEYWNQQADHGVSVVLHFWNEEGIHLFGSSDFNSEPRAKGVVRCIGWIPGNFLAEGRITVNAAIVSFSPTLFYHAVARDVVSFEVIDNSTEEGVRGATSGAWPGVVRPQLEWEVGVE